MRLILLLLFFFNGSLVYGQVNETNKKYNFDKDCYRGGQQEINNCLSKALDKYQKAKAKKYSCINRYFDSQIKSYSSSDSSLAAEYKKKKRNLVSSQAYWNKLKSKDAAYYEGGGGTITPMLIAQSIIQDFEARLKWLDNLIQEEGQGNEIKILNCQ